MIPDKKLKISLIIIAYNEEDVLAVCLEAVSQQTIMPYEVILVDNNSTDATANIAKQFSFVKVVTESSQGMIPARNRGFAEAKGDIFARIDSDTVIGKRWIERVIKDFSSYEIDGLTGPGAVYELSDEAYAWQVFSKYNFALNKRLFGSQVLWGSNMAITRKVWEEISGNTCHNESLVHEDLDLSVLIKNIGGTIMYDRYLRVHIHGVRFLDPRKVAGYHKKAVATRNYHIKNGTLKLSTRREKRKSRGR